MLKIHLMNSRISFDSLQILSLESKTESRVNPILDH